MSSPPDSTVFVVDDDPDIRTSFRWLIESVGLRVETYESADAFLEAYSPDVPGCLVLDVRMPGMSGLDLLDALRQRAIEIPVTIITAYGDVQKAVRAMKNGAIDFIEKPIGDQTLLDRIHQSLDSDRKRREELAEIREIEARIDLLTPREQQVMKLVVKGLSSKEAGEEFEISFKTVEAHRAKIMSKMQAKSVPHLINQCVTARWNAGNDT